MIGQDAEPDGPNLPPRPNPGPEPFPDAAPRVSPWWLIIPPLVGLVIAALVWARTRKRWNARTEVERPSAPAETSSDRLLSLAQRLRAAFESHLGGNWSALTTEEIAERLRSLKHESLRADAIAVLELTDRIKFADLVPDEDQSDRAESSALRVFEGLAAIATSNQNGR